MKRLFDLVAASAALIVLSPLLIAVAIAVRMTSRGPVIYRGPRIGRGGAPFDILKFRTMVSGAGPGITTRDDPRVTRVGRILRRLKIDELPQLVNILRGEMSLVGPRPEAPEYVALYTEEQRRVLSVRPGLTSAASLRYRREEDLLHGDDWRTRYVNEIMPDKLREDLDYVDHRSFAGDLKLIARTLAALVGR